MSARKLDLTGAVYRPDPSPEFLQWWYFDADFEDGHRLMVILQPRLLGRLEDDGNGPVPGCLITITTPGGKNLRAREYFDPEEVRSGPGGILGSIRNNVVAVDGGRLHLAARAGDLGVDLEFDPWFPPWPPLPGRAGDLWPPFLWATLGRFLPRARFHYASYIPRADVRGTLFLGRRKVEVRGEGYHECGRTNVSIHRIFSRWYWVRLFLGDVTIVGATARATAGARNAPIGALLVCEGRKRLASLFDPTSLFLSDAVLSTARVEGSGREFPSRLGIRARTRALRLDLTLESFFEREQLRFEDFSLDLALRPVWMQHFVHVAGSMEVRGIRRNLAGDGILEVMLTGSP